MKDDAACHAYTYMKQHRQGEGVYEYMTNEIGFRIWVKSGNQIVHYMHKSQKSTNMENVGSSYFTETRDKAMIASHRTRNRVISPRSGNRGIRMYSISLLEQVSPTKSWFFKGGMDENEVLLYDVALGYRGTCT